MDRGEAFDGKAGVNPKVLEVDEAEDVTVVVAVRSIFCLIYP